MKALLSFIFTLFFITQCTSAYGQSDPKAIVQNIVNSVKKSTDSLSAEKVYLHTDKSIYTTGDTLWFKAYLFNAAYLIASPKSGIVYIEIANEQNEVVKRQMAAIYYGFGWGNIALTEKELPQGNYTLRAYTNWMRNNDEHYIFKKQFYISSPGENDLLINSHFNIKEEAGKQKAFVDLLINKTDQLPLVLGNFQLKITEGNKTWYRDKIQSTFNGSVNFNFDLPAKAHTDKLSVTLQAISKNQDGPVYKIPVILNRPENIDLQFMPEGGFLVAGINTNIAFKALAEDGDGIDVSGTVYNSKQQQVLSFHSVHKGIGSFHFQPQPGEAYTAKIKLPDNSYSKPYPLPAVKPSGLVFNVVNPLERDSLDICIVSSDFQATNLIYLIGQSRGVPCYGSVIRMTGPVSRIKISKTAFPTGVVRITLLNSNKIPVNERIVYINHNDLLNIQLTPNKKVYSPRDSAGMEMMVTDHAGNPISGCFSVAVTDDGQVKNDSLTNASLKTHLLLTSDLKGDVQDPGYYFPPVMTTTIWQQLDNLLLAQGWVNYNWATVFEPLKPMLYPTEKSFTISGRVTNVFNKPVDKSQVVLLSKKPSFVKDTVTNKLGIFNFTNIYPADTAGYVIQSRNKKGKSFNVGVEVNEFKPPVFAASAKRAVPWYVNMDSSAIKKLNTRLTYKNEQLKTMGPNMLKEVKIIDQKVIKDSKNLNGDGGSDFAMDQEELQKAGKVTLGDLIRKNVKGFHVHYSKHGESRYNINDMFLFLIIDGVDINFSYTYDGGGLGSLVRYYDSYLNYYTAEDIKGIEVMRTEKYTDAYITHFMQYPPSDRSVFAFIEVTTYSGSGPFLHKTPGVYLYRPLAFSSRKQFYSPKYVVKTDHSIVDTRSTIYWAPNVLTDKNGKAKFSFYTADKPGTYTLLMDGCDMNGNIGGVRRKITVNK